MTTLRTITGELRHTTGELLPETTIVIAPVVMVSGDGGDVAILGDAFEVTSDESGMVEFEAYEGDYDVEYPTSRGKAIRRGRVDTEGPWTMGRFLGPTGNYTPSLVQQAIVAAQTATTQAGIATDKAADASAAAVAAGVYADQALTAMQLSGAVTVYATKAAASAATGSHTNGDFVDVMQDESRNGGWNRYTLAGGAWAWSRDMGNPKHVTPEMFGEVGAGANDNDLLIAAVATGRRVVMDGPLYRFRSDTGVANPALFTAGEVILDISPATEIRNVQTGGAKYPAIRATGSEGTPVSVTQIGAGTVGLTKTVTVSSAAGFAAGDWCLLREAANVVDEPDPVFPIAPEQDISYWEYVRISSIAGNVITMESFLTHDWISDHSGGFGNADITLNAITLAKVTLGPDVSVRGGKWTGGGTGGGALSVQYCRKPSISAMQVEGTSAADTMGDRAIYLKYCIQPQVANITPTRALFAGVLERNQSGVYSNLQASNTGNDSSGGGYLLVGELASDFDNVNLMGPGKAVGDAFHLRDGTRWCTAQVTVTGSHCYVMPVRFGSDNNTIRLKSVSGTTGVLALAGANNTVNVSSAGHLGSVVTVQGDDNTIRLDDVVSHGIPLILTSGHAGNKITGTARTTQVSGVAIQIGDVRETVIDLDVGGGKHNYASGVLENHSNDFNLRNNVGTSYRLERIFPEMQAWSHCRTLTLTQTPQTLKVPGNAGDTDGLQDLVATAAIIGDGFKISLQLNSPLALTYSVYDFVARDGDFYLKSQSPNSVDAAGGTYEAYIPKLQISADGSRLELYSEGVTNIPVHMRIEKY